MFIMLHIPEALRQTIQDSNLAEPDKILQRLPKIMSRKMFIMLHIPETLRHKVMSGLQPG